MDYNEPDQSKALTPRRVLLAVVADQVDDREALSSAFAGDRRHRVVCSSSLDQAAKLIESSPIDAIIGFVEDDDSWNRFRALADQFPHQLSVLLVTDPDEVGAVADGVALNAIVSVARQELSRQAADITSNVAREVGIPGTPVTLADPVERQRLETLTERELEILRLTAQGLAIKEIATSISRSYATVATHRNNIMEKLGLHDKVALARFAIRAGLIEA